MTLYRFAAVLVLLLAGCQTQTPKDSPVQAREFQMEDVAKSDTDMVAEVTVRQSVGYLRELAAKLYRRNPNQLALSQHADDQAAAVEQIFAADFMPPFADKARAAAAIQQALNPDYQGDRVAAYVYGLYSMLLDAYGGVDTFYFHHEYDPQKLYNLARNVEVASWLLRQRQGEQGQPLLLSSGLSAEGVFNFSYERLFGKLVALQDHYAQVVADSTSRRIKTVILGVVSTVFLPI